MKKNIEKFLGIPLGTKNHKAAKASNNELCMCDPYWERSWEGKSRKPVKSGLVRSQINFVSGNVPRKNRGTSCLEPLPSNACSIFGAFPLPKSPSQKKPRKTAGSTFPTFLYIIYIWVCVPQEHTHIESRTKPASRIFNTKREAV